MRTIINNLKKVLLVTAIPFLLFGKCNKDGTRPCTSLVYSFSVTSEWNPQSEVYKIGDTLYIYSSFPKTLLDAISNQNIDYSNATDIGGNIIFYELDSIQHQVIDGLNKFNIFEINGSAVSNSNSPNRIKDVTYQELNNSYVLKLGVICKLKGLYYFGITDIGSAGIKGKNCTNAGFKMTVINTNKNINLFQSAMNRLPVSQYEIDGMYCFRVQ